MIDSNYINDILFGGSVQMCWVGAAIGAGVSLLNGLFGKKQQDEANKLNYQMFREGLEWNSPVQQMARLKEAGLNPNMVYGQSSGNVAGNASVSTPKMEAYRGDIINEGAAVNIATAIQDIRNKKEEAKNLKAQREYINSQTKRNLAETYNLSYRNKNFLPLEEIGLQQKNINMVNQGNISGVQYNYLLDTYKNRVKQAGLRTDLLDMSLAQAKYAVKMLPLDELAKRLDIKLKATTIQNIRAAISLAIENTKNAQLQGEIFRLNKTSVSLHNKREQFNYDLDKQFSKLERANKLISPYINTVKELLQLRYR